MITKQLLRASAIALTALVATLSSARASTQLSSPATSSRSATATAVAPRAHHDASLAALSNLQDASLGSMRAGAAAPVRPVGTSDREVLRQADRNSGDLAQMKAGELSNSDITTIAVVVIAVVVVIVLL